MEYLIGLDIGTTSTKAVAFDLKGNVISKCNIGYPILKPKPSWSEQDLEKIFEAVINSIKYVVDANAKEGNTLLGVSFSSAMHGIIAVDENGDKLTDCIIWADTRSTEYSQTIKNSKIGHEIYMKTGTPIHPMSPLCKLAWMKDNMKEVFINTSKFISIKEFIFFKLFHKYVVDYSIASTTGLFNIYELQWNKDSLEVAGISEKELSTPVSPTQVFKGMDKKYADLMEIDAEMDFIIGGSDGCLANLGTNAIRPGDAAVTIGTSGAIRITADQPKNDENERIFSYILTENHFVLGGSVNSGGIILSWFRENFSRTEMLQAETLGTDVYELLESEASKVPAGANGLIFLPYLLVERAPHWDAKARDVFFGINITHKREHFLRALLEGVIFGIYSVGKALEETTGTIETIYANGGFVRSELWLQMLADVFNKKVVIAESYESSCLGAVVLGMKAIGLIDNIEEVEKLVPISKTFKPNIKNHEVYMKTFEIYERLYVKLKDEFVSIGLLQK